jgi:hypothetical protein
MPPALFWKLGVCCQRTCPTWNNRIPYSSCFRETLTKLCRQTAKERGLVTPKRREWQGPLVHEEETTAGGTHIQRRM